MFNPSSSKKNVSKTRTVTDWKLSSGRDSGSYEELVYAGSAINEELIESLKDYPLNNAQPLLDSNFQGAKLDNSSKSADDMLESLKPKIEKAIAKSVKSNGKGDRQKDWSWSYSLTKSYDTIYLPVVHSIFNYDGKSYHVWIDGQNETKCFSDEMPIDKSKRFDARSSFIPFILTLAVMIGINKFFGIFNNNSVQWTAFIITFLFGILRWNLLVSHSKQLRTESLKTNTQNPSNLNQKKLPFFASSEYRNITYLLITTIVLFGSYFGEIYLDKYTVNTPEETQSLDNQLIAPSKSESSNAEGNVTTTPAEESSNAEGNVTANPAE